MVKNLPAMQETQVQFLVGKIPWRKEWQPTPVFLPREFLRQSLAGYSPWGCKESDVTVTNTHNMYRYVHISYVCSLYTYFHKLKHPYS